MSSSQSFPDREPPSTSPLFKPIDSARDSSIALQRVTLLYEAMPAALVAGLGCALALIAVNWHVVPHDRLLVWLRLSPDLILRWQTAKGWLFVAGSAILLYIVLRR